MIKKPGIMATMLLLALLNIVNADVLRIKPYTQWTFDTPIEEVIFRSSGTGFPIYLIRTGEYVALYDTVGNQFRKLPISPRDVFEINENRSGFVLMQQQASIQADRQELLYSFQVFNSKGEPDFTTIHPVDVEGGKLSYQFTNQRTLLITEPGKPWLLEINAEDTLLFIESCIETPSQDCQPTVFAGKLNLPSEVITAASCADPEARDSISTEIRLWNNNTVLGTPMHYAGQLQNIQPLLGTDYYFLELDYGEGSSLTLFNRISPIGNFPWKTWQITPLGREAAFVITEKDFNIINLGDGSLAASFHPIDLSTISDAAFLPEWGTFLYIRYEPFFTKSGQQAYRKFELEGVNKTGRIVHKSSFGSWTTSLPKISVIGKDLFAIRIHNAVLLYRIELERN